MKTKTLLFVIGTRPEAIKVAPIILELLSYSNVLIKICATGQHRELLDQALAVFNIRPNYDLNIMRPNQSLVDVSANVLSGVGRILQTKKFNWILVQGDTTTAVSAALAGFYSKTPIAHVEAGLRSFDRYQPYPEEINRKVLTAIADHHFAPTELARKNLLREGVSDASISVTGNTVLDALRMVLNRQHSFSGTPLEGFIPSQNKTVLITLHRRETFGTPLREICSAIQEVARRFSEQVQFVWPIHPNPHIRPIAEEFLGKENNVLLIQPLEYVAFCHLMKHCYLILTDSGGIQEEAPSLGIPVLVLRETTEREEAVKAGLAALVGVSKDQIVSHISTILESSDLHASMSNRKSPFGDGFSAKRIAKKLLE